MKIIFLSLSVAILLLGCAAGPGVVRTDKGTYKVSSQSTTGLTPTSELKADSIEVASRFCEGRGRTLQVISVRASEPPYYILAEHPEIEIQFMCADAQGLGASARVR